MRLVAGWLSALPSAHTSFYIPHFGALPFLVLLWQCIAKTCQAPGCANLASHLDHSFSSTRFCIPATSVQDLLEWPRSDEAWRLKRTRSPHFFKSSDGKQEIEGEERLQRAAFYLPTPLIPPNRVYGVRIMHSAKIILYHDVHICHTKSSIPSVFSAR